MTPCARLLVACCAALGPAAAAQDSRASTLVTLDGEHPWQFEGDADAWRTEAERLRTGARVALGLWPESARGPVRSELRGRIEREDYAVENVLLETFPGLVLAGNLYLPAARDERAAAVLCPHGHWTDGRFSRRSDAEVAAELDSGGESDPIAARFQLQARCVLLARMGAIVFHYDMLGYGDTRQFDHGEGFRDLAALLHGESALGLQTWNSIRALDWLAARADVDPLRIGVTGASGGGTQTFLLCAVDPRPAAACAAVMVSTDMQGGCICENAPHLRVDRSNVALSALIAPRPLFLTGADDWTQHIEARGLPELRAVYRLFGAEERVGARCWPEFGHNYNRHARAAMAQWFDRFLGLGAGARAEERRFEPIEPGDLSALALGRSLPEWAKSAAEIRAALRQEAAERLARLEPADAAGLAAWRAVLRPALEALVHTRRGAVEPAAIEGGAVRAGDGRPDVPIDVLPPRQAGGTVLVAVSGGGRSAFRAAGSELESAVARARAAGVTVLLPELLLGAEEAAGEAVKLPVDGERHARYAGYTWCYGRTLVAERVRDLLAAIAAARALPGTRRVLLWGEGRSGPRALLAAALAEELLDGVLADAAFEFTAIEDFADPDLLPGALRYGGLDGFASLIAPVPLELCGVAAAPFRTAACFRIAGAELRAAAAPSHARLDAFLAR